MDPDDLIPRRGGDPLADAIRQDLDPLSVDELHARIALLDAEIVRTRARIEGAVSHRSSAESLFRR